MAMRHMKSNYPKRWGGIGDPLAVLKVVESQSKPVPELGEETAHLMLAELKRNLPRKWRPFAALAIGMETGRRISEIGPDTLGHSSDTLRASDVHRGADGRMCVTFRAPTLKGRNFGRGDLTITATRGLEAVIRWLLWFHPNPAGPDAPLLWSPQDPERPISYTAMRSHFGSVWRTVNDGQEPPTGMRFHAVCRTVITTLVDEIGAEKTAEFVGRSVYTVLNIYKRVRVETQQETADTLDRLRGRRRRREPAA